MMLLPQTRCPANTAEASSPDSNHLRLNRAIVVAAILLGPLGLLLLLGGEVNPLLQYDRESILAGEWWRLITGHLVHLDTPHFMVNAFVIIAWLYLFDEGEGLGTILVRMLVYSLVIGLGMLLFSPGLHWMLGASALTYALIAGSALRAAIAGPRLLGSVLFVGVTAKIFAEQFWGLESWFSHLVDYPIASEAHGYGIAAGLLFEAGRFLALGLRVPQEGGQFK